MKLKNSTIYASMNALNKLGEKDLPIKLAYKIKKNIENINGQLKFINDRRNELIKKYGKDDKIDSSDIEAIQAFMKDFNEVLEIEEDVDVNVIDVDELDGIKLSAADLDALSFMLKLG